jgi:hypothetical protein
VPAHELVPRWVNTPAGSAGPRAQGVAEGGRRRCLWVRMSSAGVVERTGGGVRVSHRRTRRSRCPGIRTPAADGLAGASPHRAPRVSHESTVGGDVQRDPALLASSAVGVSRLGVCSWAQTTCSWRRGRALPMRLRNRGTRLRCGLRHPSSPLRGRATVRYYGAALCVMQVRRPLSTVAWTCRAICRPVRGGCLLRANRSGLLLVQAAV